MASAMTSSSGVSAMLCPANLCSENPANVTRQRHTPSSVFQRGFWDVKGARDIRTNLRFGDRRCLIGDYRSSGMANRWKRSPANYVLIEVGVRSVPSAEDTPVAAMCDVVRLPNPDRDRIGRRCFIILDPEDHRGFVVPCQSDLIPILHDGSLPTQDPRFSVSINASAKLKVPVAVRDRCMSPVDNSAHMWYNNTS